MSKDDEVTMSPTTAPAAAHPLLLQAEAEGRRILLEHEVYALLAEVGIGVPSHAVVATPDQVDEILCGRLASDDAVVKVLSADVLHKSDAGGVVVCENTPEAVRDAVEQVLLSVRRAMPRAELRGALVVEKVEHRAGFGWEILGGFRHDPAFGPLVILGVGGLDTEYLLGALRSERGRVVRSCAALDEAGAQRMLRGSVVRDTLCGGLRSSGRVVVSEDRLAQLVTALARLGHRLADFGPAGGLGLSELEVNPFVVGVDGRLVALDGLARIHRPEPLPPARPVEKLRHLLTPESAVVIGASAEGMNVGRVILRNLVEGGGIPQKRLYAVHPRAQEIDGCRAVPAIPDLPEVVDMAVVAVAADKGADKVMGELVEGRRARTVTLISGGFGETQGGRETEARLRAMVEEGHRQGDGGVLVNGGNCLGIISVPGRYNTFFLPPYKLPFHEAPGRNVASISQSGAYLVTQISNLDGAVQPRYAISFGNQIDVTVSDYLAYLEADREVAVYAAYVEGFRRGDGALFLEVARRIVAGGRHVLLYKAGRSAEGGAAAASHTAAAVGDYDVCRDLVRAAGIVECSSLDMFEDYVVTFSFLAGHRAEGKRVAVLSNAGFECTAAADNLFGLELADFAAPTREKLRQLLPAGVVDVHNPVDATPTAPTDKYAACLQALLEDPGVDAVVAAGVPVTPALETLAAGEGHREDIGKPASLPPRLVEIFRASRKPMTFSVDSGALYDPMVQVMMQAGLPTFRKVDRATRALAAFVGTYR